ncbi:hypothetical protein DASC09_000280 [Saccharomycopsis crataegensis]|uniref:Uncharacterized protein n=1 Tax=Saccharomycopsis crataegensis TaxID=43959 RepID=A0AAV5QD45_9ASCO|nr:hypothetical protein DASC09_000280 [Saccharomycopsis crataegensis]
MGHHSTTTDITDTPSYKSEMSILDGFLVTTGSDDQTNALTATDNSTLSTSIVSSSSSDASSSQDTSSASGMAAQQGFQMIGAGAMMVGVGLVLL